MDMRILKERIKPIIAGIIGYWGGKADWGGSKSG